jgi:hypothetical protein
MDAALDQLFVVEPDRLAIATALRELRHARFAAPRIDSDAAIALHALDALAADDAAALDDAVSRDAALAETDRQYRELVGELCLASRPVMPRPHVRARLLASVSAEARA